MNWPSKNGEAQQSIYPHPARSESMARRQDYFKEHNYDPREVKLILPDVIFDNQMSRLLYFGPGNSSAILSS
jgi:hypothetical protein